MIFISKIKGKRGKFKVRKNDYTDKDKKILNNLIGAGLIDGKIS